MASNQDRSTVISVRVPELWSDLIDQEAARMAAEIGTRFDRSDILRIALAKHLGMTDEQKAAAIPTPA